MDQTASPSITSHDFFHDFAVPAFIDQLINIDQSRSLIDYVNRFKTANTVIFVDTDELEVHAVIDYHAAGSTKRGLAEHRAVLCLARSHEWETWNAISGHAYDQEAFARTIEVNSNDFAPPAAAALRERALHGATAEPCFVTLAIPVFTGEPKVEVKAMIKDRPQDGTGEIALELVRTRIVVEQEIARIAGEISAATSVPVIMGSVRD